MVENPSLRLLQNIGKPPEEAGMWWTGEMSEVADRTWFGSFAVGVTAFETDEGLVLVDSSATFIAPRQAGELRGHTDAPVHTAIYTHGHLDHAFGLHEFLVEGQAPPRVIAQQAMLERFERYARTQAHNVALNARQFGMEVTESAGVDFEPPRHPPTEVYDEELELEVGGVRFELRHARGETDDATWVFCPDRSVLCPGDLVIWAVPNCGNPQKAQRYAEDWRDALRVMADVGARTLCPGHGGPVVDDPALVRRILTETADYLDAIVEQTLEALNDGSPPHVDIVHAVVPPPTDAPWLRPVYDEAEFIVRNIVRLNGGWWTGRPSELKPAPRGDVAAAMARLAGGTEVLVAEAERLATAGDLRLACHLADYAVEAAPDDDALMARAAAIYEARCDVEESLMAINLFRSAAAYARSGRPFR